MQKNFAERKPSSKLTLKTKWYHSCGCCDDSRSCELLKKHVTDKYFEKVRLWTCTTFHYRKLCYHYNSWVTGVCMAYMFDRNSGGKTSQIEWFFESYLRSFEYFPLQRFCFHCTPAAKATCLQELAGCFRLRLSPDTQNRAFAKSKSCIQILDTRP